MNLVEFIQKWSASTRTERAAAQEHFIDLCRLLGEPTPNEADPHGAFYAFEKGLTKVGGSADGTTTKTTLASLSAPGTPAAITRSVRTITPCRRISSLNGCPATPHWTYRIRAVILSHQASGPSDACLELDDSQQVGQLMSELEQHFGRYRVRAVLGRGGFATVYRVIDSSLGREVALKALLPHLAEDAGLRERFLLEARAIARLSHPHIVSVHDVGEENGHPFYTMELVTGGTLEDIARAEREFSLDRLLELVEPLSSAIDYLHTQGIVHRDIKPTNVMLDQSGRVLLMDFGIARVVDETQATRTGTTLGTPEYMAPEQVLDEPVGPAADIYALAIIVYYLLAGRTPFAGKTAHVLHAQAYELPPPLRQTRTNLPEVVYSAVDQALAKEPVQRPGSARDFVAQFRGQATTRTLVSTPVVKTTLPIATALQPTQPDMRPLRQSRKTGRIILYAVVAAIAVAALAIGGIVLGLVASGGAPHHAAHMAETATPISSQSLGASPSVSPVSTPVPQPSGGAPVVFSPSSSASPTSAATAQVPVRAVVPSASAIQVEGQALIYESNAVGGNYHELLVLVRNTSDQVAESVSGQISIKNGNDLIKSVNPVPINILPNAEGLFTELVNLSQPLPDANINTRITVHSFKPEPSISPVSFSALSLTQNSLGTCDIKGTVANTFSTEKDNLQLRVVGLVGNKIVTGGLTYVDVVFPGQDATFDVPMFSKDMCPSNVDTIEVLPNLGDDKIFNP